MTVACAVAGVVAFGLPLAAAGVAPTSAGAAVRATLTWDTDNTDIDLHVWDTGGAHAWYAEQDGISQADLSTDIRYGYGPENFEEFDGYEGYTYTLGVCYFASNRDDGVVPPTIATIKITDPDGSVRVLRRRLTHEGESFLLGSTPAGDADAYDPGGGWCHDSDEPPHPPTDDGGAGQPSTTPDNPSPYDYQGCARTLRHIGVVDICADGISGDGPTYSMVGNVVLDGSVLLGDGPVSLNTDTKQITTDGPATLQVSRPGGAIPVAAGRVAIDASGAKDPITGRDRLGRITLVSPQLMQLAIAGLGLSPVVDGTTLSLYLDGQDGGGVLLGASVHLPLAGDQVSSQFTAGVHARPSAAVRVLGGSVDLPAIALAGGWGFTGLHLQYDPTADAWTASGGFTTPAFGLDAAGGLVGGRLNSIGVSIDRDVPLGQTGFILSRVGGSLDGLAAPPLKISVSASGRWGSVPGLRSVGLVLLKDVTLTVDLSGHVTLAGAVDFIKDGSPVNGRLTLGFDLSPFTARGSLETNAHIGPFEGGAKGGIVLSQDHFTATANLSGGSLGGLQIKNAGGVVSDKGLGVTGTVCAGAFGRCFKTLTLGVGMDWREFPHVRWIGADTRQFVTISRASNRGRTIVVQRGRPLLIVDATSPEGARASLVLRDPKGRSYRTGRRYAHVFTVTDAATGYSGLTVVGPRPGRWTVQTSRAPAHTRIAAQTIHRVERVRFLEPRLHHARKSRRTASVTLRWRSRGLGSSARVALYRRSDTRSVGTQLVTNRSARRGSIRLRRSRLLEGRNRFHLIVTVGGRRIDDVPLRGAVVVR